MSGKQSQKSKSEYVWVRWNEKSINSLGSKIAGEPAKCRLLPNVNKIKREHWEEFKNHPIQKLHIAEGSLELLEDEVQDLEEMDEAKAVSLVKNMSDMKEIEAIGDETKSRKIKKAARDRIKEITKALPKSED